MDIDRRQSYLPLAAYGDAVMIGSVGKTVWGGLRLGWIRAEAPLIRRLVANRSHNDLGTPILDQLVVKQVLRRMDEVLAKAEEWRTTGETVALATVVAARRSAPRPLGSKLAVTSTGRMFGSHRIAPELSPNKTIEGLVGGFLIGTMAFWFAGLYQDWLSGVDALIIGAAVAAIAPIGDLFASMVKRDLGAKDTGKLFGPHGGLLDRLDAVLFTIVVGYYLAVQLVY